MLRSCLFIVLSLVLSTGALADEGRPLVGDPINGEKLFKKASKKDVRVDGNWINAFSDSQALKGLASGKGGFARLSSDNPLDRYDVAAYIRSKNIDVRDLFPEATHVLIGTGELDQYAKERLKDRAKVGELKKGEGKHRVFVFYKVGDKATDDLRRVRVKNHRTRDKLKKDKKLGYVVFMPLDVKGKAYEIAFAVDKDIKITGVQIRDDKGELPTDLNRAAARLEGRGARGKYDGLKLVGGGRAAKQLAKPINRAWLMGMEYVYMYEVEERDYFAFDE